MNTSVPPFKSVECLSEVRPGVYHRPSSKTYPTIDSFVVLDKSVFNPYGLALILNQFTRSKTHKVDGAVIKRVAEEILSKIPRDFFPPSQSKKKGKAQQMVELLPVFLVFRTIEDGVQTAQTLLNAEGKPYVRKGDEPKVAQYAMIMDDEFRELLDLCLEYD